MLKRFSPNDSKKGCEQRTFQGKKKGGGLILQVLATRGEGGFMSLKRSQLTFYYEVKSLQSGHFY